MDEIEYKEMRIREFYKKVSKRKTKKGCILWKGSKDTFGYGRFLWLNKKYIATHRLSYLLNYGEIKKNLFILHKCDVPACVNPQHLFKGTLSDNMYDMHRKKRHCKSKKRGLGK